MIFKLFACCLPVKGATVSIICDLQRSFYHYIPNEFYEILVLHKNKETTEIISYYGIEHEQEILEYFNYMVTNEYGFWCKKEEIDKFPNIQLDFDSPEIINNVIIDIDFNTKHNLQKLFIELNDLKTKFLEVRIYTDYKVNSIKEILSASFGSRLRSINILTKYTDELSHNTVLESIIKPFPILGSFVIHSTPIEIIKEYKEKNDRLKYIAQIIDSEQCCGNISMQYFSININTFTEAQQFNTCLNKKVAIDKNGLIKNCPSMNESFGEFNLTSLTTVVSDPFFKEKWGIKKDEIKVCKDCQFRYICTDCRAYIADKSDKPLKCNYDPYTNKWNS